MKMFCSAALFLASISIIHGTCSSLVDSYRPSVSGGMNVWVEASVLYWEPWEKALVATNQESDVFVTDDFASAPVVYPDFDWDLGYRVNGGYLFCSTLWDTEGSWTHFSTHISQNRSSNGSPFIGMFPIWSLSNDVIAGDYVFESDLSWKITVNEIDLQFGRYIGNWSWLDLKPYFGLRSAWIKQNGSVEYEGGMFLIGIIEPGISLNGTDLVVMKNNYWGMGPRIGVSPRFALGKGFSINGDAAVSGLYGFFTIEQEETYLNATRFSYRDQPAEFRWIADFAAGIQWKVLFCEDRYAITLKADWEYHLFWDQFMLQRDRFGLVPENSDLTFQGVSFSGRFDF